MEMLNPLQENFDLRESTNFANNTRTSIVSGLETKRVFLDGKKLEIPACGNPVVRRRLTELLVKSTEQFGAALVLGRSGTGKTALASAFAGKYEHVSWYAVDSADSDWNTFFRYFVRSVEVSFGEESRRFDDSKDPAVCIEDLILKLGKREPAVKRLFVLDNIHHVFDSDWFLDVFNSLIHSISPEMHLLMLSRCQPPNPLWRLRSKQRLGVIDERLLAFNKFETIEYCRSLGLSDEKAQNVFHYSFGRISKIKELIKQK